MSKGDDPTLSCRVREAVAADRDAVAAVTFDAFAEDEGELIAGLAVDLLDERTEPPILPLMAELDGAVVGFVVFSPVWLGEAGGTLVGYTLAPLAVAPERQRQGVGKALVSGGLERVRGLGAPVAIVYGDPKYYGRFGFAAETAERFHAPHALQYPFGWLGLELDPEAARGLAGEVACVGSLDKAEYW